MSTTEDLKHHREGRYRDPYQERLPPTIAEMRAEAMARYTVVAPCR